MAWHGMQWVGCVEGGRTGAGTGIRIGTWIEAGMKVEGDGMVERQGPLLNSLSLSLSLSLSC